MECGLAEGGDVYHYSLVVQTHSGMRCRPIVVHESTHSGRRYKRAVAHTAEAMTIGVK